MLLGGRLAAPDRDLAEDGQGPNALARIGGRVTTPRSPPPHRRQSADRPRPPPSPADDSPIASLRTDRRGARAALAPAPASAARADRQSANPIRGPDCRQPEPTALPPPPS